MVTQSPPTEYAMGRNRFHANSRGSSNRYMGNDGGV